MYMIFERRKTVVTTILLFTLLLFAGVRTYGVICCASFASTYLDWYYESDDFKLKSYAKLWCELPGNTGCTFRINSTLFFDADAQTFPPKPPGLASSTTEKSLSCNVGELTYTRVHTTSLPHTEPGTYSGSVDVLNKACDGTEWGYIESSILDIHMN